MNANDERLPVWHCPDCFHVASRFETTCRHCGCRYQPSPVEKAVDEIAVPVPFVGSVLVAMTVVAVLIV